RMRITAPWNGSSPTKRFDPPPSTNQSSPPAHTSCRAWMSSARVAASSIRSGAAPVRRVVSPRSGIGVTSSDVISERDPQLRLDQYGRLGVLHGQVDARGLLVDR